LAWRWRITHGIRRQASPPGKENPDHNEEWKTYQPGVKLLLRGMRHDMARAGIEMLQSKQQGIFIRDRQDDQLQPTLPACCSLLAPAYSSFYRAWR